MNYPTTRMVFDRKHTASAKKKGLVQLEILYNRKRKWVSTGVKLYKDQWNDKTYVVNSMEKATLNQRLVEFKGRVDEWINMLIHDGAAFTWEGLERFLSSVKPRNETFIDYVARRIEERNDIKGATKRNHRKLVVSLERFGRIVGFEDLTKGNIADYYNYLLGKKIEKTGALMKQQTVASYMKFLKIYIRDAIRHDIISEDPTAGMKIKRGESEEGRWLTEEEVRRIQEVNLPSDSLRRVRDMFLIQCYTGMAYADLMDFEPGKIEKEGNLNVLCGRRVKTGESYIVVVLPTVLGILDKYGFKIPRMSGEQYNMRLKLVADAAGVNKPIASHWGRRTCGMLMLNNGYPIEVVAKVLGHSDIRTTQKTYAKILRITVIETFKRIEKI